MKVGIDKISFYTPNLMIDMKDLAIARNQDPNKFLIGIGQSKQSVIPNTQDVVTMAANAAFPMIDSDDLKEIDLVIFGTETGIDNSKSAAIYLQNLLGLSPRTRSFEIKQACYGATAGVQMAHDYINNHPDKKALVIGADVARYGLNTPGEVTQGGGAVAMIISSNPKILSIDPVSTFYSEDVMDFWRPLAKTEAVVDGHYSNDVYVQFFQNTWQEYCKKTGLTIDDFKAFAFHLPYTKMGLKALRTILPEANPNKQDLLKDNFEASRYYGRLVGNLYTGSLYLSLLSLLDNATSLKGGDRIGLFSYGSGAQGEFYSGKLESGFFDEMRKQNDIAILKNRKQITIKEYEDIFQKWLPIADFSIDLDTSNDNAQFVLSGILNQKRKYLNQNK